MPEAAVAPSAPSTPAAAPAASSGPAWADGNIGTLLAGVTSDAPAPAAPAPQPATTPPPAAPAAPVVAPAIEPPAPVVAPTAEPANPVAAPVSPAPEPARLLAGRFKTVEDLEKAYDASSVEGRKNFEEVKTSQAQLQKITSELELLKIEKELGPEIKDPSPEEIATWDAVKVAKFYADKSAREYKRDKLEQQRQSQLANEKREMQDRGQKIVQQFKSMETDELNFPRAKQLEPIMREVFAMAPALAGQEKAPTVLYFAAYGFEAFQRDKASRAATDKATAEAKTKAAAAVPAASGGAAPSAPAPVAPPPANAKPEAGSDEEHNARLIATHTGQRPTLPMD